MMYAIITTKGNEHQTAGRLDLFDEARMVFSCVTLEPPWLDNKQFESCIPGGDYKVKKRYSEKYGHHFILIGVEGRSYILIHSGNYVTDSSGCVLVGKDFYDINKDGLKDVTHSQNTLAEFYDVADEVFDLKIDRL